MYTDEQDVSLLCRDTSILKWNQSVLSEESRPLGWKCRAGFYLTSSDGRFSLRLGYEGNFKVVKIGVFGSFHLSNWILLPFVLKRNLNSESELGSQISCLSARGKTEMCLPTVTLKIKASEQLLLLDVFMCVKLSLALHSVGWHFYPKQLTVLSYVWQPNFARIMQAHSIHQISWTRSC